MVKGETVSRTLSVGFVLRRPMLFCAVLAIGGAARGVNRAGAEVVAAEAALACRVDDVRVAGLRDCTNARGDRCRSSIVLHCVRGNRR